MPNDDQLERNLQEQLRAAALNTWRNPQQRQQFQSMGIYTSTQLENALEKAAKDQQTRSFDRQPNGSSRDQSEPAKIFQATITGRDDKQHQVTLVLSAERDQQGRLSDAKAYVNEPGKPSGLAQELDRQYRKGEDPKVLMRGGDLSLAEERAQKSPISRLEGMTGPWDKPTYEPDKQMTPAQVRTADIERIKSINSPNSGMTPKPGMSLLERLQQQKPDISKEIGERQRQIDRSHDLSR